MSSSSSPTSPTPSSPTQSPTPSSSSSSNTDSGQPGTTSSTLYLFTFLATLFVLLLISSAIILRSFVLRRRFRRRVEEAIAAGIYIDVAPRAAAGSRTFRVLGEKPKFYETWITPTNNQKWDGLMPISAQIAPTKPSRPDKQFSFLPASTTTNAITTTPDSPPRTFLGRSLRNPFTRAPPSPPTPPPVSSPVVEEQEERIAVSVLISMPSASRSITAPSQSYKGKARSSWEPHREDGEMPDVILGVAELPYSRPSSAHEAPS
ncbi:hypothetical protein SERLA73DRAFT_182816 [Serpula lacrymans var. lacrymans S7.3]|uniref:Uncharacterized protein n=2 Tax=Serpula lacrymans var. lacrymans TaxID=341189 RepID=F8Q119_SERL3|nr:uncharacterized protein SERLADRAFT_469660 [Serpula lacrymans var. lacrymans S7.9]EGN97997.1 hypothetical protein SERLA73DRAFT_182816 [Serpula lacrymans var. lacrymans S7.3]EGO23589.1 hypothetical protein SERLADRAFT_469660 [Serpula lacrymans var. lacrymans S7.9]